MKNITRTLLIGLYLSRLAGTCVGQCFTKINKTIGCQTEAFVVEGVMSTLHCAYKCHRDENCALFRYTETSKLCKGCISYGAPSTGPVDTAIYKRTVTGSPYDERDAACLTFCAGEKKPDCQDIMMLPLPSLNATCFEICKDTYDVRYYADKSKESCLCGYNRQNVDVFCDRVCPKRGK